jgi:hypothetical protein
MHQHGTHVWRHEAIWQLLQQQQQRGSSLVRSDMLREVTACVKRPADGRCCCQQLLQLLCVVRRMAGL